MPGIDRGGATLALLKTQAAKVERVAALVAVDELREAQALEQEAARLRSENRRLKLHNIALQRALDRALGPAGALKIEDALKTVEVATGLSRSEIISRQQRPTHVRARFILFSLALNHTTCSTPQIGQYCAGRDHSSIIYGVRRACDLLKSDPDFAAKYAKAEAILRGDAT